MLKLCLLNRWLFKIEVYEKKFQLKFAHIHSDRKTDLNTQKHAPMKKCTSSGAQIAHMHAQTHTLARDTVTKILPLLKNS